MPPIKPFRKPLFLPRRQSADTAPRQRRLGTVVSENSNGAENSNPRSVLEIGRDQSTRDWLCDSSYCQPSLDTSHPKRPSTPVLNSFVLLDTTRVSYRSFRNFVPFGGTPNRKGRVVFTASSFIRGQFRTTCWIMPQWSMFFP